MSEKNSAKKIVLESKEEPTKEKKSLASVWKRLAAYLLDLIIISFISSFIYTCADGIAHFDNTRTNEYTEKTNALMEKYTNEDISSEEYVKELTSLSESSFREVTLEKIPYTLINFVVVVLYVIVYAFYKNGQTIGKKMFNIRVVRKDGKKLEVGTLIMRGMVLYSLYVTILESILVFFVKSGFFKLCLTIEGISGLVVIISAIMILFNDDKCGIHDKLAKTKVISEI